MDLDEKSFIGAILSDVGKAFDNVLFYDLFHKLTVLNFLSYLVKTILPISSHPYGWIFAVSSKQPYLFLVACGLAWIREE